MSEMSKQKVEKIQHFYEALLKVQPDYGHDIGLIIVGKETAADIQESLPNPNSASVYELDEETAVIGTTKQMLLDLFDKRTVIVRLHGYLDPRIYNQLYLISQSGRTDFFLPEASITFDVEKDAALIIVTTQEELDNLNYKNILEITGPVLRLED